MNVINVLHVTHLLESKTSLSTLESENLKYPIFLIFAPHKKKSIKNLMPRISKAISIQMSLLHKSKSKILIILFKQNSESKLEVYYRMIE